MLVTIPEPPTEISITKVDRSKQQSGGPSGPGPGPRRHPVPKGTNSGSSANGGMGTNGGGFMKVRNDLTTSGRQMQPGAAGLHTCITFSAFLNVDTYPSLISMATPQLAFCLNTDGRKTQA